MKRFLLLAIVATSALVVTTAQARPGSTGITVLPRHIIQGDDAVLTATVSRSETCSLTIKYAHGKTQRLGRDPVKSRQHSWVWLVPPNAAVGKAKAQVACIGAGVRTGTFVVRRRPRSSVAVIQRGFTQLHNGRGGTNLSWGVVLVNHSDQEAANLTIYANFLDAAGHLVLTDSVGVAGIAPGATFYAGSVADTAGYPVAMRLVPVLKGGHSTSEALLSPEVTNVQVTAGDGDGSAVVDGNLTNDGTEQLSSDAVIFAVLFNTTGKVIGGGLAFPPTALAPGAHAAFEIHTGPGGPAAGNVSQVKLSANPTYGSG